MISKKIKAGLYAISGLWTVWILMKPFNTSCFNYLDTYITLITIMLSMILNDLIE